MYYSQLTNGFYDLGIHSGIPSDAVEITKDEYAALLEAQASGQRISADANGYPIAIDPPQLVRSKASLLAEVAAKRWAVETGGILIGGTPIATDRESQAQLSNSYASLKNGLIADTHWKAANGTFTLVTMAELEPVAQAVAAHVRACFAAEQAHNEAISALQTQLEMDTYDIGVGWPTGQ